MKPKESIQRQPLTSYFVLAYGLPWVCILTLLATKGFRLAAVQPADASLMILFQLLGPSVAGLLLTAMLEGRTGLRGLRQRFTRWRVAWPWYGVALLAVPLLTLAILSSFSTWLGPDYAPRGQLIGLGLGLLAGAFEETGWTGFATPRLLQRFSPLKAGLLLGFLWPVGMA